MKPLQSIAMGLVIIAVEAWVAGGYDALPDPVGWLLVLLGLSGIPASLAYRPVLRVLGSLALLVSAALWLPSVRDGLERADVSLLWAADLPQLAFVGLLCLALSRAAAGEPARARWLRTAAALTGVAAVVPVLVLGAGADALLAAMIVGASLVLLLVIVLFFRYSSRPWARPEVDQTTST
ncbi:MAG TPA: hypothetical protein VD864_02855 [Nocardioides sp.]|nr:hypothetical protein [Nocardioides sp.]